MKTEVIFRSYQNIEGFSSSSSWLMHVINVITCYLVGPITSQSRTQLCYIANYSSNIANYSSKNTYKLQAT